MFLEEGDRVLSNPKTATTARRVQFTRPTTPPPPQMGCETTCYECMEHRSIRTARLARYVGLFLLFSISLVAGILVVVHFPTNINCPPSFNAQGLGILFILVSCYTCVQTVCYWYDANSVVHRTSTQEIGDLPVTVGSGHRHSAAAQKEVFVSVDIGHKTCSCLSACWQVCAFMSCFGIGLALMTGINSDGTVMVDDNNNTAAGSPDNNSTDTRAPTACDGNAMYLLGVLAVVVSLLFFITMCWRVCRDPQTYSLFRMDDPTSNDISNPGQETRGGTDGAIGQGGQSESIATNSVELTMQ